ncbi:bacteriohemerythrin [Halorientalis litorea]|uniref:bacteriohemerythrin n=1 Tax=Halorientalis litorea TaxID=2931977 RepID=UPI001FF6F263|nr:bacteriohemerythrin [Halorientalis litorea]
MAPSSQEAFAEWDNDRYSVGIERFDEQHQRLFGLLNDLHTAMDEGHSDEKVGDILRELERYTDYHFGDEEEFMQDCGYAMDCSDCFFNHREMHDEFAERVTDLREKHENGQYITMEVLTFVRDWLDSHIAASDVDQNYGEYYEEEVEDYEYNPGGLRPNRGGDRTDTADTDDQHEQEFDLTVESEVHAGGDRSIPEGPLADWFKSLAEIHGERTAVRVPEGGRYTERSFDTLYERAREVAGGLLSDAFRPGDRVAIVAESGYDWSVVEIACQIAGLVSVPIYPSLDSEQTRAAMSSADVDGIVCETETPGEIQNAAGTVVHIADLPTADPRALPGFEADDDDVATIVFDASSPDEQSAIALTHENLLAAVGSIRAALPLDPGATGAFPLPFAHVFPRVTAYYLWSTGGSVTHVDPGGLTDGLAALQPDVVVGTPRIYQQLYGTLQDRIGDLGWMKRKLAGRVASYGRGIVSGRGTPFKYSAANRLVFKPLREETGLANVTYALSGAGHLDEHLVHFLRGFGVPVSELHGPVEASGVGTLNPADAYEPGTAGRPLPGTEFALSADGDVLVRGPTVMAGYLDDDATARAIRDGWLLTGDTGAFDEDGRLHLDREE